MKYPFGTIKVSNSFNGEVIVYSDMNIGKIERLKILFRIPFTLSFLGRYYLYDVRFYGLFRKSFNPIGTYCWIKL